ncbi:ABC-type Fe3+/spermidine/putrescine transport system ATPase subunit [Amycolatopsis bartoniae]|uniref:ABC-type quaternary amine transporter n=1 Tax=Amycolatopsis bartoniae TaxID=941986 RepID=A0A8H9ISH3_9PSEU|nr:ABC transporter ATP-binding protein [Amycolatopsis bartoniae]MBB2937209.1 ABC-type Fe3+/spermidine/putrescine transport system ATPase subunit [Amycolatopsis bartoniae]GHF53278.1 ABC transporter ATP-binding protein [Amycolatopsis bartoniae]
MSEHLDISGLTAGYDGQRVLDVGRLTVGRGEFLSVLGPSGCGKTTLLNTLAGFVRPQSGSIRLDGEDVTGVPPYRRGLGLVFQNYALFPHLSVADNVAYGLKARKVPKRERAERVEEALRLVSLEAYAGRRPRQLSGGQQQRVAVARALAIRPALVLLDEPLSNLDAKLRREMRVELRALQQRLGITMVFVTHDQEEALSLSDRIAVMNGGRVEQVDTPEVVYREPATRFVAEFLGAANVLEGRAENGVLTVGDVRFPWHREVSGDVTVAVRPERVRLGGSEGRPVAKVALRSFLGDAWQVELLLPGGLRLTARAEQAPPEGTEVAVSWEPGDVIVLR